MQEHDQQHKADELLEAFGGDYGKAAAALKQARLDMMAAAKHKHVPKGPLLIEVAGVTKTYSLGRQKVEALKGVSVQIHQGEFIAITGASGSGKSTLLQLIGGLDKPTAGTVTVDGHNISKLNDRALSAFRNRTVGFIFQFFYLQPFLRLDTNLEVPAMFARTKKPERAKKARELAKAVGLDDRLQHFPRELSGGQMQRAAIARALLNEPKVLLADEPTGNLDSENGRAILELFESIREKFGTTIIVVTHDNAIARRADRRIVIKDGEVAS
jgi:ABC-type lipoprotein export system ATPase subunit